MLMFRCSAHLKDLSDGELCQALADRRKSRFKNQASVIFYDERDPDTASCLHLVKKTMGQLEFSMDLLFVVHKRRHHHQTADTDML